MSSDIGSYYLSTVGSHSTSKLTPMDLDLETNRGISFKRFLKQALRLKSDDFLDSLSRTRQWLSDASVRSKFDDFKFKVKAREDSVTRSFVDFSNTVLETAMKDLGVPEERQIKLLYTRPIDADEAIPDVAIVHVSMDETNVVQHRRVEWQRMLGSLQVWYPKEIPPKKRSRVLVEHSSEEPPLKRSKSPRSKSTKSVTAPSSVSSRVDWPRHRSPSVMEASEPSSSSCGSSGLTLCEESAEGELVSSFTSMFSARGDRTHVMGACFYGTLVKLMFASHTGIIESNEIDLVEEPELFVIFLSSFATSSFADIGFNSKTGFCNPCNVDDAVTRLLGIQFETHAPDNDCKTQPCLDNARLGLKIVSQKGLVDRATSVYHLENTGYPVGLVLKYSWQVKTRRQEYMVIREARQADPLHTPELFGTVVVDDPSPFEDLREACIRKSKRHEPRELRVLVMRRYHPLAELGFGDDFWDAFTQLLGCAHDLYRKKEILHHDISMKNLAYYRGEGRRPIGVLIDFDLATMPPLDQSNNKERIGTVTFMSSEILFRPYIKYGLHHDFESFFYCAIWHGRGYEISEHYPREEGSDMDILYDWRVGQYSTMGYHKNALTPKHKAFHLMRDQEFSKKCLKLWEVFDRAMYKKKKERSRQILAGHFERVALLGIVPGSKATYTTLMEALGREVSACGEECCI